MIKKGIKADISLEKEKLDAPFGVDYFLWLPTKDHTAPSQDQLKAGVKFMDELIKNKIKIYIHCQRGHGRAPVLVAAYFISKYCSPIFASVRSSKCSSMCSWSLTKRSSLPGNTVASLFSFFFTFHLLLLNLNTSLLSYL